MPGMNLPPPAPNEADERRAVPRHIRDGEHDGWQDAVEPAAGAAPGRRFRLWVVLLVIAAAITGLWLYNS
jgi:hypothetical protein